MPMEGRIDEFSILEVLSLIKSASKTGKVMVIFDEGKTGEIYVVEGKPVHAIYGTTQGENALLKMIKPSKGKFIFTVGAVTTQRSIESISIDEIAAKVEEKQQSIQSLQEKIGDLDKYLAFNKLLITGVELDKDEWNFLPEAFSGKKIREIAENYEEGDIRAYELINSLLEKKVIRLSTRPTIMSLDGRPIGNQQTVTSSTAPTSLKTTMTRMTHTSLKNEAMRAVVEKGPSSTPTPSESTGTGTINLKVKIRLKTYMSTTGSEVAWVDTSILSKWEEELGRPVRRVVVVSPSGKQTDVAIKGEEGIGNLIYLLPITSFRLKLTDDDIVEVTPLD